MRKGGDGMDKEKRGSAVLWALAAVLIALVLISFLLGRYPVPPRRRGRHPAE